MSSATSQLLDPRTAGEPPGPSAAARAPRRRAIDLAKKLAVSLSVLLLTLAVLEVATRQFSSITPPLLSNHPVLGTTFLPGFHGTVYVPECDATVELRFNREGLRGDDVPYEKPPGVRRVAILGDSMIAAIATDESRTLCRLLAERLNASAAPGVRYEVLNCGVSGSSTAQELVLYRQVVRRYQPDVVICAFCVWNDLGDNSRELTSSRARVYFQLDPQGELEQLPLPASRARLAAWLNRHSRFYVWQRHKSQLAINVLRNRASDVALLGGMLGDRSESGGYGIFATTPTPPLARAWTLTEALLDALRRDVEADGARFAVAVLPSGAQVHDDVRPTPADSGAQGRLELDFDYPERRLGAWCREHGIDVIRLADRFRQAAPHHSVVYADEWLHYEGQGHFNDRGNRVAAEGIYDFLAGEGATTAARAADSPPR